ncbi:MAG: PKD domain-containing protein [Bacteroidia bacterium]
MTTNTLLVPRSLLRLSLLSIILFFNTIQGNSQGIPGASCPSCKQHANASRAQNPHPLNGNGSLALNYTNTACGLNYVTGSVVLEQRTVTNGITSGPPAGQVQPATITIAGIPTCATIVKAFLYADASGNGIAATATLKNPLGTSGNYPMTIIGQDIDKCWGSLGYTGTYSYRADVTAAINGNGSYIISGMPVSPVPGPNDMDGASLIIIYSDPSASYTGTIAIADGAHVSTGSSLTDNISGFTACAASSTGSVFLIVGDLQQLSPTACNFNSPTPNYTYPAASNSWWDLITTTTTVTAGLTNYSLQTSNGGDCYNEVAFGLYFQTGCNTCSGSGITVTVSSTSSCAAGNTATANVTGGNPPYTYSWTGTAQTTQTVTGLAAGTYTVTVKDNSTCNSGTAVVTIPPGVGVGTTVASTNPLCNGQANGTATVTATGGVAPYTYSWSPAPGAGQGTSTASALAPGTYVCSISDAGGCTGTSTVTITQPPAMTLTTTVDPPICIGQSAPLTATGSGGTPAYTYSWTNAGNPVTSPVSPVVTTTYTVTVTDSKGCVSAPQTDIVKVNPPLAITVTGTASVCGGGSTPLNANATGGNGSYTYSWTPPTGLSSTTISNPNASPTVTTTYTVAVADNCGTTPHDTIVTVTVRPAPAPVIKANIKQGCVPLCVTFTDSVNPACASATWNFGDGNTGTGCGPVTHCYTGAGVYSLTFNMTDVSGCTGSVTNSNYITVYPSPVPKFSASPQPTSILDPYIQFTDMSTGASSWSWTFGDVINDTSTKANPHYVYPDTGCYQVQLVVTSVNGCKDSIHSPVCIEPDFEFFMPNAFTPNNDHVNDLLMPKGIGIISRDFDYMIFDRWGNLLFETHDLNQGWDGHANGGSAVVQEDTYVWRVSLLDFHNHRHIFTGGVQLIR